MLFDQAAMHSWTDRTRAASREYWSVRVPVLISDPFLKSPPARQRRQFWTCDIGYTGAAYCLENHLREAGLDPAVWSFERTVANRSSLRPDKVHLPARQVRLWIPCDTSDKQTRYLMFDPHPGVVFGAPRKVLDPEFDRPLIGMKLLANSGLKIELDFVAKTFSIWLMDEHSPNLITVPK